MSVDESQQYVEDYPISELVELPENPRQGDVAMVEESINELGFYGACIVDRDTRIVLAGNHRMKAAQAAGRDTVPVLLVDGQNDRGRKIALTDNHSQARASFDVHHLLAQLQALGDDLQGTGYTSDDVADLLAQVTAPTPEGPGDGGDGGGDDDSSYWPTISVQVPPSVFAAWGAVCAQHSTEAVALQWLLEQHAGEPLDDDAAVDEALASLD